MMETHVFISFFLYSCAMFTFPFVAFFGAKHMCSEYFLIESTFTVNVISVFAAVIIVNLIIMMYAYKALKEPEDPTEEKKDD